MKGKALLTKEKPAMLHEFTCAKCGQDKQHVDSLTTGYARVSGDADKNSPWDAFPKDAKICFACCGDLDRDDMIRTGRATLYLTDTAVSNWPNTLSFKTGLRRKGYHNIARERVDVWFHGPDKALWHGVMYGRDTQICHCKRTKAL